MLFVYNPDGTRYRVGHLSQDGDLIKLSFCNIRRHLVMPNVIQVSMDPSRQIIYILTADRLYKLNLNDNFVNTPEMLLPKHAFKISSIPLILDKTQVSGYHIIPSYDRVYLSPKVPSYEPTYEIDVDLGQTKIVSFVNNIESVTGILYDTSLIIQTPTHYSVVLNNQILEQYTSPINISHDKKSYICDNNIHFSTNEEIKHVKFPSKLSFYGNRWVTCLNKLCDFSGSRIEVSPSLVNITDQIIMTNVDGTEKVYTEVNGEYQIADSMERVNEDGECQFKTVVDWVIIDHSKDNMSYLKCRNKTIIFCSQPEDDVNYTFYDVLCTCKEIIYDKTYCYLTTNSMMPDSGLFKQLMFSNTNTISGHIIKTPKLNLDEYMMCLLSFHPELCMDVTDTENMFLNDGIVKCDVTDISGLKRAYNTYQENITNLLVVKQLYDCIIQNDADVIMITTTARQSNWLKILLKEQEYECLDATGTCYDMIFH